MGLITKMLLIEKMKDRVKTLIKKLIRHYLLPAPPFKPGDAVVLYNGDEVFDVAGFFYDADFNLVMLIQDNTGRLYQADHRIYKRWSGENYE